MDLVECVPARPGMDEITAEVWETPNPMAIFSPDDRLAVANVAFRERFFVDPADQPSWREFMRHNFHLNRGPKIDTDDFEVWLTSAASRRGTMPFRSFEAELHDGSWLWVTETVRPDGTLVFVGTDVTALKPTTRAIRAERDAARRESWTDDLTGVANRRYIMGQLALRLEELKIRPENTTHVVALLDIDHFKNINDQYGHEVGDDVLVAFSRLAVSNLRVNDLFGRIGGEEFLLLMPNCALETARARMEQLLDLVCDSVAVPDHAECRYTFSGGLTLMSKTDDIDALLKRADQLLYRAKDLGRKRIVSD